VLSTAYFASPLTGQQQQVANCYWYCPKHRLYLLGIFVRCVRIYVLVTPAPQLGDIKTSVLENQDRCQWKILQI